MSQTMFIHYRDEGFWAYDVAVGVLLKHVIDRACLRDPAPWLSECIERWRVNAIVSDFGMHLDPEWTGSQSQIVRELIEEACQELQKVEVLSADEAASWKIHNGKGVFARGASRIPTAPSIELGRAVSMLLEGTLPAAPAGSWWFYGTADGVSTIRKLEA